MCVSSFLMWKISTPTCPCFPNMSAMFTELAWVVLNSKPKQKSRSSVLFVLVCLPETCDDVTWFGFRFSSDFQESPDAEDYELGWTFNLEFVFFFLLEMLKMFTSSVITSLWHHGFAWCSPVTPLCVLVSCTSIFESSHELLFARLYCSNDQAIRYANLLPHLGSFFLGRRLQLLLMFLSMVYFSFLRKFKQFSLVSIRWFTFSTFFHTSVVSHEQ